MTYVSIGLELYLANVVLKDNKLYSAYVINGSWHLKKVDNYWTCGKSIVGPVRDDDFILIPIPKKYSNDYNLAINYAITLHNSVDFQI